MRPLPDLPAPVSELTSPTVAGGSPLACRPACAACCIAPSISTPIPGMPDGKPAGVRCVQLDAEGRCALFGQASRPAVCLSLQPSTEMCGANPAQALQWLARLEAATAPSEPPPKSPTHDKTARGYRAV